MQEYNFEHNNSSLYYRVSGKGEPVIFVHGFGEDGTIWLPFVEPLEAQYKLIIPDLLGSGRSSGSTEGISIESFAEQLILILDREGMDTCSIIGHSMGGYATLAFAEKYTARLNRFGLFHSTAFPDDEEKKDARRRNIDFIEKHGAGKFMEYSIPNLFSEESGRRDPGLINMIIDRYLGFSSSSLTDYTKAMIKRPDRIKVLESFPKPVLFLMGEQDIAIPVEQGLKQCHIPELSYIYIGTHSGHMGMLEEPEFYLQAIRDFLSGS